jgi:hypothetical protein
LLLLCAGNWHRAGVVEGAQECSGEPGWWCTPVVPAFRRWRQKYLEFQASLGYIERSCLQKRIFMK